jgi:1-phosphatidylinositol phosphodiesterase
MNILSEMSDAAILSQLNIAGTHDSATAYVSMENVARCQDSTIAEQLNMGVRLLDIRLTKKGDEFYLVHAFADCYSDKEKNKRLSFGEVLEICKSFLRENPAETIILSIKQDRGIINRWFFPPFYDKYIRSDESSWYLENKTPTLGQCRGKLVLMRRCRVWKSFYKTAKGGLNFSFWPDQARRRMKAKKVRLNKETTALIQDRYCLDTENKWICSENYMNCAVTDKNKFALHYISTSVKTDGKLVGTAEYINKKFMEYPLRKGTGWIFCDFPTEELIEKIMTSNIEKSEEI